MSTDGVEVELASLLGRLTQSPGDQQLWELFHHHSSAFLSGLLHRLVPASDVEDVSQDVFARIVRQVGEGKTMQIDRPWGWLKTICLSTVIDYRRRSAAARRQSGPLMPLSGLPDTLVSARSASPSRLAEYGEKMEHMMAAFSPAEKSLFEFLGSAEAGELPALASLLQISPGALAVRITRLKSKIEKLILD